MSLESAPQQNIYTEIKEKLLSGEISLLDFRNKLIELDQSTLDRKYSLQNLELLQDPEVVSFIETQEKTVQKRYYNFLSFTEFHVGQYHACEYKDQTKALEHFKKSLEAFEKGEVDEDYRQEWGIYVRGTIAYLEKNTEFLKKSVQLLGEKKNALVLSKLLEGLEKRGEPSYLEDY